jgi:hypothetical protein
MYLGLRSVLLRGGIWPAVGPVHPDAHIDAGQASAADQDSYGGSDPDTDACPEPNPDQNAYPDLQRERHTNAHCPICDPDSNADLRVPDNVVSRDVQLSAAATCLHAPCPESGYEPQRGGFRVDRTVADAVKGRP